MPVRRGRDGADSSADEPTQEQLVDAKADLGAEGRSHRLDFSSVRHHDAIQAGSVARIKPTRRAQGINLPESWSGNRAIVSEDTAWLSRRRHRALDEQRRAITTQSSASDYDAHAGRLPVDRSDLLAGLITTTSASATSMPARR